MKIKHFITIVLCSLLLQGFSQNVSFTAESESAVSVGDRFRLTFTVNAEGSGFRAAPLPDFNVLSGPSTSQSTSMSIINGKMSQSVSISYTYVLEAVREGKFTVNPAQITVNGKVYKSNSISIQVVKGNAPSPQAQGQQKSGNAVDNSIGNDNIFVRVDLSTKYVYEGEPIVATLKIYVKPKSGLRLSRFGEFKFPSFTGFFSQVIEEAKQISLNREVLNGQIYDAGLFKKVLLYPQMSGKLTIDPFMVETFYGKPVGRDFFGQFVYDEASKKLTTPATIIQVKPLPSGAPASFSGAVGSFGLSVGVNKTKVKANEAITLRLKINGTGNLKLADHTKLTFPADFESYTPKLSTDIKNTIAGSSGSKTWEYLVIPRHSGTFTIPAVKFAFFDTKAQKYKELSSDEFIITVEKGNAADNQGAVVQGYSKEDVKFLGSDIRYINTENLNLKKQGSLLYGTVLLWIMYLLPLVGLLIIVIVRRKQIKENSNWRTVRSKQANKVSRTRLKQASIHIRDNKDAAFYEEVMKAAWGYMSDKLGIPVSELTKDKVVESLTTKQINSELGHRLVKLLDQCEFARFAPSAVQSSKEDLYTEAEFLINEFEKVL